MSGRSVVTAEPGTGRGTAPGGSTGSSSSGSDGRRRRADSLATLPVAAGLRPIAAGLHVAPATLTGPRLVEEDPLAGVVRADANAVLATGPEGADDRLGDPGERIVDRVADVAVTQPHAVRGRNELEPLAGTERPVHLGDGRRLRRLLVGDRVGNVPES